MRRAGGSNDSNSRKHTAKRRRAQTSEAAAQSFKSERDRYAVLVKKAGVKLD